MMNRGVIHRIGRPFVALVLGHFIAAVNDVVDHRKRPPARGAIQYAQVIPSVVRIMGYDPSKTPNSWMMKFQGKDWLHPSENDYLTVGTGVVIVRACVSTTRPTWCASKS